MSRVSRYWAGHLVRFLILLMVPVMFVAAVHGWVVLCGRWAADSPIPVTISRHIASAGDDFELAVGVSATLHGPARAPEPLDIVIVLDRSQSMYQIEKGETYIRDENYLTPPLADLLSGRARPDKRLDHARLAAATLVTALCSDAVHFSVIEFDSQAQLAVPLRDDQPLSRDTEQVLRAIDQIRGGSGRVFLRAIEAAADVLSRAGRSQARKVILFLSDGKVGDADAGDAANLTDQLNRRSGANRVEVYAVGVGRGVGAEQLENLAVEPHRFTQTTDEAEMTRLFLGVGMDVAESLLHGVRVRTRLAPGWFELPGEPALFVRDVDAESGRLEWQLPAVFHKPLSLQTRVQTRTRAVRGAVRAACYGLRRRERAQAAISDQRPTAHPGVDTGVAVVDVSAGRSVSSILVAGVSGSSTAARRGG
ncbi:MAG: VWA domain-containing protein [Proteobacteria bacterium]|nr:VWA domain-containing protein [Pseudomonadota bacterium]